MEGHTGKGKQKIKFCKHKIVSEFTVRAWPENGCLNGALQNSSKQSGLTEPARIISLIRSKETRQEREKEIDLVAEIAMEGDGHTLYGIHA